MAKEFSAVVKSVRTRLKMSQEELARELGVSFATVNRWENSRTKPSQLAQRQFESFREVMRNGGAAGMKTSIQIGAQSRAQSGGPLGDPVNRPTQATQLTMLTLRQRFVCVRLAADEGNNAFLHRGGRSRLRNSSVLQRAR